MGGVETGVFLPVIGEDLQELQRLRAIQFVKIHLLINIRELYT